MPRGAVTGRRTTALSELWPFEDPARRCLKVEEWPETDRLAWETAMQPGDILDGTVGPGHHWSDQTRKKYRKGYGRWLTFLIMSGQYDGSVAPAARLTRSAVGSYLEKLNGEVASWTCWGRLAELLAVIKAMAPDDDWTWLRRIVRRLETRVQDSRNKLKRLRSPEEIVNWAFRAMETAKADLSARNALTIYRTALMVALLAHCPIRLGNLAMIEVDRHLVNGPEGFRLTFDRSETKTRKPLTLPVPSSLAPQISFYLKAVRPLLLQGNGTARLWITRYGLPMEPKAIHNAITDATRRAFGEPINPHLFRDCAATFVALNDPKHIGIAAPILGHTDPRTTERHYIQANQVAAGRRLRTSVDELRRKLHPHRT